MFSALSSALLFFSGWNKRGSGKSIVWPSLYSLYYSGHFYVGYFPPPGHKVAIKKIFHFLLNQHTFYLLKRQCVIFVQRTTFFYPRQPFIFKNKTSNYIAFTIQSSIICKIRSYKLNNTLPQLETFFGFSQEILQRKSSGICQCGHRMCVAIWILNLYSCPPFLSTRHLHSFYSTFLPLKTFTLSSSFSMYS